MRALLYILMLGAVLVAGVAGWRGSVSRRPPLELYPDMMRQPRLRPATTNALLPGHVTSQPAPRGTLPFEGQAPAAGAVSAHDVRFATGLVPGSTVFVETLPVPVTRDLLARGRRMHERFCQPCHGAAGDGKGIVTRYGLVAVAPYHDARLIRMPDGELFDTLTQGKNLMGAFGDALKPGDRWAVIAWMRVLQRARLGMAEDVPEAWRGGFEKPPPPIPEPPVMTPETP